MREECKTIRFGSVNIITQTDGKFVRFLFRFRGAEHNNNHNDNDDENGDAKTANNHEGATNKSVRGFYRSWRKFDAFLARRKNRLLYVFHTGIAFNDQGVNYSTRSDHNL